MPPAGDPSPQARRPGGITPETLRRQFKQAIAQGDYDGAQAIQAALWRSDPGLVTSRGQEIPLLAWERQFRPADRQHYLFVSGTPRSGTTALARLLNTHRDIALYIELFSDAFGYHPAMFSRENIDLLNQLGLLPRFNNFNNPSINEAARNASLIGDKRPNFMRSAELTLRNFADKDVIVLHIVRPIHEVAHSFMERARLGTWSPSLDHVAAVTQANMNNWTTLRLLPNLGQSHRILVVNYETFWNSPDFALQLFSNIGLDANKSNLEFIHSQFTRSLVIQKKERSLAPDVRKYIEEHYDFQAEAQVKQLAVL